MKKTEKFDFAAYEERIALDPLYGDSYVRQNGTLVEESVEKLPVRWEVSPQQPFYVSYKEFYSNGNLKKHERFFGRYTKVGVSAYYNKTGKLQKEIDEGKKFGKIKPEDIIDFLEKKKIDAAEFEAVYNKKKNIWYITIPKGRPFTDDEMFEIIKKTRGEPNDRKPFEYVIDGNTGEVISSNEDA